MRLAVSRKSSGYALCRLPRQDVLSLLLSRYYSVHIGIVLVASLVYMQEHLTDSAIMASFDFLACLQMFSLSPRTGFRLHCRAMIIDA